MIIDLDRFRAAEAPYWTELEKTLDRLERDLAAKLTLKESRRFYYLYQRAAGSLARLQTFAGEPDTVQYLESLVARAYGELHETRARQQLRLIHWLINGFPNAFRRHLRAFQISCLATLVGAALGTFILLLDYKSKSVIIPFSHLMGEPGERVAKEESAEFDHMEGQKSRFSAYLMTHNIQVSIFTMALGMTYGVGTIIMLFYNGVILGVVATDYIAAGYTKFLLGWLLPHGAIEIPAILVAGQAGLVLGSALIGRGSRVPLRQRLVSVVPDVCFLIYGLAVMLVWAGFVESFLSQYHEPVLPYALKITIGVIELIGLTAFLAFAGRKSLLKV